MPRIGEVAMGSKHAPKQSKFDSDSFDDFDDDYDDYEDDFDDNVGNLKNLSKDFYSTDWEDPSDRLSARRKIERKKEFKESYSEYDDEDEIDFGNEW